MPLLYLTRSQKYVFTGNANADADICSRISILRSRSCLCVGGGIEALVKEWHGRRLRCDFRLSDSTRLIFDSLGTSVLSRAASIIALGSSVDMYRACISYC